MIVAMKSYPPMGPGMISNSPLSLRNKGYVVLPPTYFSQGDREIDDIQKVYLQNGLQGLGLDLSSFDPTTLFSGTTGTFLLIGGAALLLFYFMGKSNRQKRKEEIKRAKQQYKQKVASISQKYGGRTGLRPVGEEA